MKTQNNTKHIIVGGTFLGGLKVSPILNETEIFETKKTMFEEFGRNIEVRPLSMDRFSSPYLIQRGWLEGEGSLNDVSLDYMGSAEFEWGAIPASYKRVLGAVVNGVDYVTNFKMKTGELVYVRSIYSKEQTDAYIAKLKSYLDGDENSPRLKEYFKFDERCNVGWDIDNDIVFSTNEKFINNLNKHLKLDYEKHMKKEQKNIMLGGTPYKTESSIKLGSTDLYVAPKEELAGDLNIQIKLPTNIEIGRVIGKRGHHIKKLAWELRQRFPEISTLKIEVVQ